MTRPFLPPSLPALLRIRSTLERTKGRFEEQAFAAVVGFDFPLTTIDGLDGSHGVAGLGVVNKGEILVFFWREGGSEGGSEGGRDEQ